jgi:hypothetical protein
MRRAYDSARPDVLAALPGWIVARLLVLGAWVASVVAVDRLEPVRTIQQRQGLFAWDGSFYRAIAEHGYRTQPREALRFFPLFPLTGRVLSYPLFGHTGVALLLVANVAALVFGALVHRLVRLEIGDPATARRAAWLAAIFPSGFVLVWAYAEALMLAAAVATFVCIRRGNWWWAAAFGGVAALTRPLGVLLVLPVAIEALRRWARSDGRARAASIVAVTGPIVGIGVYLAWAGWRFDDWQAPLRLQHGLRGDTVEPVTRVLRGIGDLVGSERLGDGLHIPFAIAFVALAVVVGRRLPASYTAYTAAVLVVALSAENLNSVERYGLNAFPIVIAAALVTRDERVERGAFTLCGAGLVALTTLAWCGAYVP